MKRRVADIIVDTLLEHGIKDCFLVVGGGAMHLDNALVLNDKIRKICNHHEQACTMACDAYSRISGRMAAACVTSGPGATNAITGVMGAYQDSIPMIVISGQVRYEISSMNTDVSLRYRGIQEFDIVQCVKNMTKYAVMLTDPFLCKYEVEKAINIAMTGRRGPVWVDVPLDIQSAIIETDTLVKYDDCGMDNQYGLNMDDCKSVFEKLVLAKRPCVLAGTGIVSSDTREQFEEFVDWLGIPVIAGGWCTDALYTIHPLYYGLSGDIAPRAGNFILQNADVILVLGNSLSYRQTGYAQDKFAPGAKILWVDADENESKKPGMRYEKFVRAEMRDFFRCAKNVEVRFNQLDKNWIQYCDMLKKRFSAYESIEKEAPIADEKVNSYYFWKLFDQYAPDDVVIAMGNSRVNAAKIQIGVKERAQRAITNYLCGAMGFDLPAAEGCAVASGKEVICVTGDGSIMMNIQELQTIAHNRMPVKVVVFSNGGYEAIRQTCKNFFGGTYIGCTKDSGVSFPDFQKLSDSFGFRYRSCEANKDVSESLKWLFSNDGNLFLEVKQKEGNTVTPKVMSRIGENGLFVTPALHDMSPFLSECELSSLMFEEFKKRWKKEV